MKAQKLEVVYCIDCERFDVATIDSWHIDDRKEHICFGPFTFCAPPVLEEDWELNVSVPSPDELAEMNATVSELMTEFELV